MINDLYKRLLKPDASQRHYVWAGRVATSLLLLLALLVGGFLVKGMMAWFLFINNVMIAFILPLAWLRFFWWRLNIWGEIAALAGGLPLSYIIWFPLDFAHKPFWQGFLLLLGAGWVIILAVTLLTPAERTETLEQFYRICRPPGFWGKITETLPTPERQRIKNELRSDIWECALGISFCTASVAATANLFGRHWPSSIFWLVVAVVAFWLFARRWTKRGIFKSLSTTSSSEAARDPILMPRI